MLIEALGAYEGMARKASDGTARAAREGTARATSEGTASPLPKILCIVTGKGPLKTEYMRRVGKLQATWKWVRCVSLWLEAEDYPLLLGAYAMSFGTIFCVFWRHLLCLSAPFALSFGAICCLLAPFEPLFEEKEARRAAAVLTLHQTPQLVSTRLTISFNEANNQFQRG